MVPRQRTHGKPGRAARLSRRSCIRSELDRSTRFSRRMNTGMGRVFLFRKLHRLETEDSVSCLAAPSFRCDNAKDVSREAPEFQGWQTTTPRFNREIQPTRQVERHWPDIVSSNICHCERSCSQTGDCSPTHRPRGPRGVYAEEGACRNVLRPKPCAASIFCCRQIFADLQIRWYSISSRQKMAEKSFESVFICFP